jgi:multiple sugar transport system ATP-binding protein
VAGFIGSPSMNLLPVTLIQENGHYRLQNDNFRFVPQSSRIQAVLASAPSQNLFLGVRHTSIPMLPVGTPEGIPAQVYTVEPTGDVTFVHLQIGNQLITASTDDPHFQAQTGENLVVKFDENRLHLFDAETSLTLTN